MKDELLFCPLGGSGEIGMNMNLFAYGKPGMHKWIIVDIGVTFADDSTPGIDLIYPDPGFIVNKKDDLLGIVLTHAHEDHIGAIAHIWPQLKCKIFANQLTILQLFYPLGYELYQKYMQSLGKLPCCSNLQNYLLDQTYEKFPPNQTNCHLKKEL